MELTDIKGIGPATAASLQQIGVTKPEDLFSVTDAQLAEVGIAPLRADEWRAEIASSLTRDAEAREGEDEAPEIEADEPETEKLEAPEPDPGPEPDPEDDVAPQPPDEEYVELTFVQMFGRPHVGEVLIKEIRFRKGVPVWTTRADADAILARPQYKFRITGV